VSAWLTVKFPAVHTPDRCGTAQVAVDGGWIELEYHVPDTDTSGCRVPGFMIPPRTIRHEIGHALGFWHTGDLRDVMSGLTWSIANATCFLRRGSSITPRLLTGGPGNVDPDTDTAGVVNLAPIAVQ
jgi:hypothetical protein